MVKNKFFSIMLALIMCLVTNSSYAATAKDYHHDATGNLSKVTFDDGSYTEYTWEDGKMKQGITYNRYGNQTGYETYSYDAEGKQTRLTYTGNTLTRKEVFNQQNYYNTLPWVFPESRIYYDQNVTEYYSFNDKGLAYKEEQYSMVNGHEDKEFYQNRSYRRYYEFAYEFDEDGNVIQRVRSGDANETFKYTYDEYGNLTSWTDKYGNVQRAETWDDPAWRSKLQNSFMENRRGKLIYTVEEASKVSKPTGNTFKIRYK